MSMTTLDAVRSKVESMMCGIERYNPENVSVLEHYVEVQCQENGYDLEANLALLKLYQFNPTEYNVDVVLRILLKALTHLPHSDLVLCKSLLSLDQLEGLGVQNVLFLANLLETCRFKDFWSKARAMNDLTRSVVGFEDAVRKFVSHVINVTYQHIHEDTMCQLLGLNDDATVAQWIQKNGWKSLDNGYVLVSTQEEAIKTKKITENIDLEGVATIMANCY